MLTIFCFFLVLFIRIFIGCRNEKLPYDKVLKHFAKHNIRNQQRLIYVAPQIFLEPHSSIAYFPLSINAETFEKVLQISLQRKRRERHPDIEKAVKSEMYSKEEPNADYKVVIDCGIEIVKVESFDNRE